MSAMPAQRKIIHVDMDAFYAAVEQRDDPTLRGRPVIVGGAPNRRGVVATCSYEARTYGIHSAMSSARAERLCPDAVFLRPRFEVYRRISTEIRGVMSEYTELLEPLSLDEAYLDVSDCPMHYGSATLIAKDIKRRILAQTGLTASAGVSYNKFLAKIASDMDKPDGLHVIKPTEGPRFVARLPVKKFHGVGRATADKMHGLGIRTGADLREWSLADLQAEFGSRAGFYYQIARGVDERPVQPHRERKSLGSESTFPEDLSSRDAMLAALAPLASEVLQNLQKRGLSALTWTLKVKYEDFVQVTRARTLPHPPGSLQELVELLATLLDRTEAGARKVRLLGVTASTLAAASDRDAKQLVLL